MNEGRADSKPLSRHHHFLSPPKPLGFLGWIVVYKLVKMALAVIAAIAAFRLTNRNLVEVGQQWLFRFGFDPDGRIASRILAKIAGIDSAQLKWVGIICLAYGTMYVVEGVGLYLELRWAEWLTVLQSSILVPPEIYAIIWRPSLIAIGALVMSILTIGYLLWRIRRDSLEEATPLRPSP